MGLLVVHLMDTRFLCTECICSAEGKIDLSNMVTMNYMYFAAIIIYIVFTTLACGSS